MIVAIHQPNYLPWLGYFRKLKDCDVFVFYDNVQMPIGKSFVTRSKIKTAQGTAWLTVPTARDSSGAPIADTPIIAGNWPRKHLMALEIAYARSPWLDAILKLLRDPLQSARHSIAELNVELITRLAGLMGLKPRFVRATALGQVGSDAGSIEEILRRTGATTYLTGRGTGSMRYLDVDALAAKGIATEFVSADFLEYPQRHGGFESRLSIVDALLNCGPEGTCALLD
jgi:hypothetical protein